MITVIYIIVLVLILWLILAVAEDAEKKRLVQQKEVNKEFEKIEEQRRESERLKIAAINIEIDILEKKVDKLFNQLKIRFDEDIANKILEELGKVELNIAGQIGDIFYRKSLTLIVTHNASEQTKLFVLNVGRWYYSNLDFWPMSFSSEDVDEFIQEDINDIQSRNN